MKNNELSSSGIREEENNIFPAAITEAFVPRLALMNLFHRAVIHRFVYASAPAGGGKTVSSLLWLDECGRRAIRICLVESDNVPGTFYKQFANGIISVQKDNEDLKNMVSSLSFILAPVEYTIRLLNSFQPDDNMYALVLDDIHHIDNPEILKSLPIILRMLPTSFAVLFLSRGELPEYLREFVKPAAVIKPAQFLFTEDEIRKLFESYGRFISPNEARVVHVSTGGLPIGINTVAKTGEIKLGQEGLDAADFLTDQLFNGWRQDIQIFMQKTCIADEITPELANRLTGQKDSKIKLDWLCATNAYITKTGEDTYRYHRIFLDFLREKAGRFDPSVYKIVGDYYYEIDQLYIAMIYYGRSGDYDSLAPSLDKLIKRRQAALALTAHLEFIKQIDIEGLSEHMQASKPYLYIWCMWKYYMIGDLETACVYSDKIHNLDKTSYSSMPFSTHLMFDLKYLDFRKDLMAIQKEETRTIGAEFAGDRHNMCMYTLNMPFVSRSCRDASEYANYTEDIEEILGSTFRALLGANYQLYVPQIKAELYFEKNMLVEAKNAAAVSASEQELLSKSEYVFSHHMICAVIAFASGKTMETVRALEDMETYIEDKNCEYLLPNFLAVKTKLSLYDADQEAARTWLNNYFVIEPQPERLEFYKVHQHFTTARAYIVLGRHRDALDLLAKLNRLGTELKRPLDIAEAGVLQAIVEWAEGKKDRAVNTLEDTLTVIQPYRFVRVIANEAGSVMPVLTRLASKVCRQTYNGTLDSGYVNEVSIAANQFAKLHGGLFADAERNVKILKLSKRQKQVLILLSKGYKNKRIAEEMGLDIITVKGHQVKAYKKLGVHTGIEAVFKARELGIVE